MHDITFAGAGKTEPISRWVASLIVKGVEPGQVVAFADRAAVALKARTPVNRRGEGSDLPRRFGPMFVE